MSPPYLQVALDHARSGDRERAHRVIEDAIRDGARAFDCYTAFAAGLQAIGMLNDALDALLRAALAKGSVEDEMSCCYEIADAYERRGSRECALYYFQAVARTRPFFDDPRGRVRDRIAALIDTEPPDEIA